VAERRIFRRVRKIATNDYYLRHICPSFHLSDRMEQLGCHGWIFMKFLFECFSKIRHETSKLIKI